MSNKLKTIPLCQLRRSAANTRKTDRFAEIKQLAASIEAKGLLENLVVQPTGNGEADSMYEVVAGGRRLAALKLLVKRKKLARDHRVPCLVLDNGSGAIEASLTENFMRVPPHPADQFEAFAGLARDGLSTEAIAARFGITKTFVEQRLKLASVSPRLVAEYRAGAMTLDQLTAFTLSDDHTVQEDVWFERGCADMPAQVIRRMLTSSQVQGSDRRALFVGAKAYEQAGGVIVRDLFDTEDEGYFTDSQLLDRLVFQKLEEAAQSVRGEGWAWVEVHPDLELAPLSQFGRAETVERPLSDEAQAKLASLGERYDELVAALEDGDEGLGPEIDRIDEDIAAIESSKATRPDEEKARAGAIVSLGPDGTLDVVRGLLKPEASRPKEAKDGQGAAKKAANGNGYADSVVLDLSAHKTAAMRELLAQQPTIALLALLHVLVGQLFGHGSPENCLRIAASAVFPEEVSGSVGECPAGQAFSVRHAAWAARLPQADQLWDWLLQLPNNDREQLLAHCVGMTVDAIQGRHRSGLNQAHADTLAAALGLDMRAWWRPTQAHFLGRITKNDILTAVSEGVSQQASWRLAGLKKDRMAREAEKLLASSNWLPPPLRDSHSSTVASA